MLRNLIVSTLSYVFALITAFWCFLTWDKDLWWYAAGAMIFGFVVVFCLTDLIMRGIDRLLTTEEE